MEILDKANYVTKMWANPCALPWFMYAELAIPAAAHTVLDYVSLGSMELVREAGKVSYKGEFTPSGRFGKEGLGKKFLGASSHGRGKRGRQGIPTEPDFKGGQIVEEEGKVAKATKFLWRALAPLERGLFIWFIAELAADFAYNFTSLVYQCEQCNGDTKQYPLQLTSSKYQYALAIVPYNYITMETTLQNNSYLAHEHSTVRLPQGKWTVLLAADLWAPDGPATKWKIGIHGSGGIFTSDKESESIDLAADGHARPCISVEIEVTPLFDVTIYPYAHCEGKGNILVHDAYMVVTPRTDAPCMNVLHPFG